MAVGTAHVLAAGASRRCFVVASPATFDGILGLVKFASAQAGLDRPTINVIVAICNAVLSLVSGDFKVGCCGLGAMRALGNNLVSRAGLRSCCSSSTVYLHGSSPAFSVH